MAEKCKKKLTFFNFSVNFQKYTFIFFNVTKIIRWLYYLSFYLCVICSSTLSSEIDIND